jgi:hypothetical protein
MATESSADAAGMSIEKDSHVLPTDTGGSTASTLRLAECNDCAISRLLRCLMNEGVLPATYKFPEAPIKDAPLELNIIGLRVKNTISNKFDDRLIALYRPIDLDSEFKIKDPDTLKDLVNIEEIESYLSHKTVRDELRLGTPSAPELPGQESLAKDKSPCQVHGGWKLLKYEITTDPGLEKKANSGVSVSKDEPRFLKNGRAVLEAGALEKSHRIGIHHWGDYKKGYVALVQSSNFNIRRAWTAGTLIASLRESTKGWKKKWEAEDKRAHKQYEQAKKTCDRAMKAREAYDRAVAAGKKGVGSPPKMPPDPTPPNEINVWLQQYIEQQLNMELFSEARQSYKKFLEKRHSFLRETREKMLSGMRHDLTKLQVDYTLEEREVKPGKPDKAWVLDIKGLLALPNGDSAAARTLTSDEIVVVSAWGGCGINIHHSSRSALESQVFNWSEGCQVFHRYKDYQQFRRLYGLSKRAHCSRRQSKKCPSFTHSPITVDDLLWHYFSTAVEKADYLKAGKTADDMLRDKLAADDSHKEYVQRIKDRIQQLEFNDNTPPSPPPKRRFFTITEEKRIGKGIGPREELIRDCMSTKLLPNEEHNNVRETILADAKLIASLQTKLKIYIQGDLDSSSTLQEQRDATLERYIKAIEAAKGRKTAAQVDKEAEKKTASDAELAESKRAEEKKSAESKIQVLGKKLEELSKEVEDEITWTAEQLRKAVGEKKDGLNQDGLEYCDLLGQCDYTFDYILVEALKKEEIDPIDDRLASV